MAGRARSIGWSCPSAKKAYAETGNYLPDDALETIQKYVVAIKGPLTTPIGKGIRSLNVAIRQRLDLYACVRPVRYIETVPKPHETSRKDRHGGVPRKHRGSVRRDRVGLGK